MGEIYQRFRISLDLDWHTDPVVECEIRGDNLQDVLNGAKQYGAELAAFTGGRVKKVDLVNGHEILGFIKIPL